jgi:hypothetical protein
MTSPLAHDTEVRGVWPFSLIHRQWLQAQQARGVTRVFKLGLLGLELLLVVVVVAAIII